MEKIKRFLFNMVDMKKIFSSVTLPFTFTLLLITLVVASVMVLSYFNAPPDAYTVLIATLPITTAIINSVNNKKPPYSE